MSHDPLPPYKWPMNYAEWYQSARRGEPLASHRDQIADAERRQANNQGEQKVTREAYLGSDYDAVVAMRAEKVRLFDIRVATVPPIRPATAEDKNAGYGPGEIKYVIAIKPGTPYHAPEDSKAMDALVGLPDKEGNRRQAEKEAKEKLPRDILDGLMISLKRDYSHTIGLDSVVRNLEIARAGLPFLSKKGKMTP